jgi:bacterioferritin
MPHQAGQARLALIKHESSHLVDEAPAALDGHLPQRDRWQEEVIELLNDALAPELVCVLRYRPQQAGDAAPSLAGGGGAQSAGVPARSWPVSDAQQRADEMADRIADRIVDRIMQWELGGDAAGPRSEDAPAAQASPREGHVRQADGRDPLHETGHPAELPAVHRALLGASGRPVSAGPKDPVMRRMRDDDLREGEEHADDWLAR